MNSPSAGSELSRETMDAAACVIGVKPCLLLQEARFDPNIDPNIHASLSL